MSTLIMFPEISFSHAVSTYHCEASMVHTAEGMEGTYYTLGSTAGMPLFLIIRMFSIY